MNRVGLHRSLIICLCVGAFASASRVNATMPFDDRCLKRGLLQIEAEKTEKVLDTLMKKLSEEEGWACELEYGGVIACARFREGRNEVWSSYEVCQALTESSYVAYYKIVRQDNGEGSYGIYAFDVPPSAH